ncbi:MAG TPA: transposase [Anaerolineales bacterium]|nr:transposase [Anaerolineales bacterium]
MPDYPKAIPVIPKETARAANAIFGRSNFYILIGEHLDAILEDLQLPYSSERGGVSNTEELILALITFFQFVEGLSDIQAVAAVRTRTDWKFALHLSLIPAMVRETALCDFRQRISTDPIGQSEFQKLIDRLVMFTPPLANMHNLKSLELISIVCSANRLDWAQQAMEQVLEVLAARSPAWLRTITLPHWYGRYNGASLRFDRATWPGHYNSFMEEIGADIHHLLEAIHHSGPREISELSEVKLLDQVWSQQFQTLPQAPNIKSETLNFTDCDACPYQGAGRRI